MNEVGETDTWYKCTICGREGRVGRCCGDETRIPLNNMAKEEQASLSSTIEIIKCPMCSAELKMSVWLSKPSSVMCINEQCWFRCNYDHFAFISSAIGACAEIKLGKLQLT